ncbi:MAG: hypothetical protein K2X03_06260 [Bryobacteraceae bacterium]|nr:hypothetical protein [Bryobacteraceae bacterium]
MLEFAEGLFFFVANQEAAGEVVPVGVLTYFGFACLGARTGGALAVVLVGGLLGG